MFLVDHNKIQPISFSYDIIKYTIQEYSKSIPLLPLRISKLRRKLLKKKKQTLSFSQKRDQEIRLFPFLFEKKTKRSATHPLLFSRKPRNNRETKRKKIEQERGWTRRRRSKVWPCPALPQRGFALATKGNYGAKQPLSPGAPGVICIIPDTLGATIVSRCAAP